MQIGQICLFTFGGQAWKRRGDSGRGTDPVVSVESRGAKISKWDFGSKRIISRLQIYPTRGSGEESSRHLCNLTL